MSSIIVSQGKLYQIVKKRKLETIEESEEADQTDGKEIDESRIKNKRKNWKLRDKQYRTKITKAFVHFCRITCQKTQKWWQEQEQFCGGDQRQQTLALTWEELLQQKKLQMHEEIELIILK